MGRKTDADWEAIEKEYRAGILSLRLIASTHGVTEGAVRKRALKDKWTRALADRVRAQVAEKLARLDGTQNSTQSGTHSRGLKDSEIVDFASSRGIEVVRSHRVDISQLRALTTTLADRLAQHMDGVKQDGPGIGDKESPADMLMKLASIRAKIIPLERQAFNLDDKEDSSGGSSLSFTIKIGNAGGSAKVIEPDA